MKRGTRIGVDVGGTTIRVAAVTASGRIVQQCASATSEVCEEGNPLAGIIQRIKVMESERRDRDGVEAVGLALPATLDEQRDRVVRCVHVPGLQGRAAASEVTRQTGIPCRLLTDIEAATWAEYVHGKRKKEGGHGPPYVRDRADCRPGGPKPDRFLHLRVGTGVGLGVVIDGRIHRLDAGRSTHLPALVVDDGPSARPCSCGLSGCLERYCSGAALMEEIRSNRIGQCVTDLQSAWDRGDAAARSLMATAAAALTKALRNLETLFCPAVINLGGGVIARLPALTGPADPPIESAKLGDHAGVLGAAILATLHQKGEDVTDCVLASA